MSGVLSLISHYFCLCTFLESVLRQARVILVLIPFHRPGQPHTFFSSFDVLPLHSAFDNACLAQRFLFALLVGACTIFIFIFIGVCRFRPTNTSNFRSGPVWQPCLDLVTTCSNFRPTFFFMLRIYVRALLFCFYFISFVSFFFFQGWLQGKQDTENTMNLVERAQEAWVSRYLIFKVCSPEKSMIRSWPARISVLLTKHAR